MIKRFAFLSTILLALTNCSSDYQTERRASRPITSTPTSTSDAGSGATDAAINSKATALLATKCAGCHNSTTASGGFGAIENPEKLIASGKYVVPGQPEASMIYLKTNPSNAKPMPPTAPLSDAERALIKEWISNLGDQTSE